MTQDGGLWNPTPPDAPQPEGATIEELTKELAQAKRELACVRNMFHRRLTHRGLHSCADASLSHLAELVMKDQDESLRAAKTFRTETLIQLRAIAFVLESCIGQDKSGPTHYEKNVRLRGVVEQIQRGIARLNESPQREPDPNAPPF